MSPILSEQIVSTDGELHFALPAGWHGQCRLRIEHPNFRFVMLEAHGPEGSLVFCGHADQPLHHIVPVSFDPRHIPGARLDYLGGAVAIVAAMAPPAAIATSLIERSFPGSQVTSSDASPALADQVRSLTLGTPMQGAWIDAGDTHFTSPDGMVGMMRLAIYGHAGEGMTWDADYISGYRCRPEDQIWIAMQYEAILASQQVGETWRRTHRDLVPPELQRVIDAQRIASGQSPNPPPASQTHAPGFATGNAAHSPFPGSAPASGSPIGSFRPLGPPKPK
jgi:hypothetical protein